MVEKVSPVVTGPIEFAHCVVVEERKKYASPPTTKKIEPQLSLYRLHTVNELFLYIIVVLISEFD